MKSIFNFFILATVLLSTITLRAQNLETSNPNPLIGVWEYQGLPKIVAKNGDSLSFAHQIKIINSDSTFLNLKLDPKASVISHQGTYCLNGNDYFESIANSSNVFLVANLKDAQKLTYRLSEDKNTLYLSGDLKAKNGNQFRVNEVWKRITIANADNGF